MRIERSTPDVIQSPPAKQDGDALIELRKLLNDAIKIKQNQESFIGRVKAAIRKIEVT